MTEKTSTFSPEEQQRVAEAALRSITLATSRKQGEAFYRALVQELAQAMDVHYVIVGELVRTETGAEAIQTLAVRAGNDFMANIRYELANTPCRNVADQSMCFHPCNIQQDYPLDTLLVAMQAESYIGMPMIGSQGKTLGILVALDVRPMDEAKRVFALSLLSIFSARAAAELEHQHRQAELEAVISERTSHLKKAHRRLLEQEKLAALGSMVAGIAHEINTPLGVAVTASSSIQHELGELRAALNAEKVSRSELLRLLATLEEATEMTVSNLLRTGQLVNDFKHLAVAQEREQVECFPLAQQVDVVMKAYCSLLESGRVRVECDIPEGLQVCMAPGILTQLLAQLLQNALQHAFPGIDDPLVRITARPQQGATLLQFADNGVGASAVVRQQMFDPFFTTRRAEGNTGLGLNVVFNLVQQLQGDIEVQGEPGQGLCFELTLPDQPLSPAG
ncbi:sensor histidine kinase [Chitinilyticum piscinae]|uniref:histidine kinase n=1 Tax=Chitinilyticum piscinae TaxID=2866724 RepID=A0A8J7K2P3_9NEIS|nr:GAF domain-containing sensor histidine kinase [Chitinilyticum piscinae]MBE9610312.1 GAF domain-containing sensor histidine kinase [Chitinilyticum piscinae]